MQRLIDLITQFVTLGGPVVSILLVLSIVALTIAILKLLQFWREGVGRHQQAQDAVQAWASGHQAEALGNLRNRSSLVDQATLMSMSGLSEGEAYKADIEEAVTVIVSERLHGLQSGFRALDSIAQIAPLLGLFGTVLGMITAFQKLQEAGNAVDPSILAGGIWVALLTTAVGLAVAMPVSLLLTWFETRLENERVAVETIVGRLLNRPLLGNDNVTPRAAITGLAHAH